MSNTFVPIAVLNDLIEGMTDGEHFNHYDPPHPPLPITGYINGRVSKKITINDLGVAVAGKQDGSTTKEFDDCCIDQNTGGVVVTGFSKITIDDLPVAMIGSKVKSHSGTSYVIEEGCNQQIVRIKGTPDAEP